MRFIHSVVILVLIASSYADFSYSSFSSADANNDFNLIGAAVYDSTTSALQLVQSTRNRIGAAFHVNSDLTGEYILPGFITQFTYQISAPVGLGGAGLAFVLQPNSAFVAGTTGAGIGYGDYSNGPAGITNSIAIEFDSFFDSTMNDPNANHCGAHSRGQSNPNSSNENFVIYSLVNTTVPNIQDNTTIHTVYINYQAISTSLIVMLDGEVVLTSNIFNVTEEILLDATGESFVGITSSTNPADYWQLEILSWDFWAGNGTIVPSATVIYGAGYDNAIYNSNNIYYIQLIDNYGFNLTQPAAGITPNCSIAYGTDVANLTNIVCSVTYLSDGLYQASYFMNLAGTFTLITQVDTYVNTSLLVVTVPPAFAGNCVASGAGISNATVGVVSTFYITTYDSNGVLTPDVSSFSVTLTLTTNSSVQVTGSVSASNGTGIYSATYTVTISGSYSMAVNLLGTGAGPIQSSPFTVFAAPGVYVTANCYGFGQGTISGIAGAIVTFNVQAVDQYGNNATSPLSWVITSGTTPLSSTSTTATGTLGLTDNTYNQTTAGIFPLIVGDGTTAISNSPFSVNISPAGAFPGTTTASVGATGVAGVSQQIVITPRDQWGNLVQDANIVFVGSFTGASTFQVNTVTYNGDGTYTLQYSTNVSGSYSLVITLSSGGASSGPISGSPFSIVIAPGPIDVASCYAFGAGIVSSSVGLNTFFSIQTVDSFGNLLTTSSSITWTASFNVSIATFTQPTYVSAGIYTGNYTASQTGTYALTILGGLVEIQDSPYTVSIAAGAPYAPLSYASGPGYTNAIAGLNATFTVNAVDFFGNPTSVVVPCTGNLIDSDNNVYPLTCSYDGTGNTYTAVYNLTIAKAYTINVYLNSSLIQNSPNTTIVSAGAVYAPNCVASGSALTAAQAGVTEVFNITARDQFNNFVIGIYTFNITLVQGSTVVTGASSFVGTGLYYANYTLTSPLGDWTLTISYNGLMVSNSPSTVVLSPGPAVASQCYVTPVVQGTNEIYIEGGAHAYEAFSYNVQAVDQFGNNLDSNSGNYVFEAQHEIGASDYIFNSTYSTQSNLFVITPTLDATGSYIVVVTLGGVEVSNSPLTVSVGPGFPNAANTTAFGPGTNSAIAGETAIFYITTKDMGGVNTFTPGLNFTIDLLYTVGNNSYNPDVNYQYDASTGFYNCTYNATKASDPDTYNLSISLNSGPNVPTGYAGPILNSPYHPTVVSGPNCPQFAEIINITNGQTIEVNVTTVFLIQSVDCFGNDVDSSDVFYSVLIQGPDCSFGEVQLVSPGLYNVTFIVTVEGNYTIYIEEGGVEIAGSPIDVWTGSEATSELSSTSLLFMWLMIVFIILYVIFCLLLIGFVVFTQRKQLQRKMSSNYNKIGGSSSSSSSSSD